MFQTVLPSIIRRSKLHIQHLVFVRPILLLTASLAGMEHPSQVCWQLAFSKPVWHIPLLRAQWKTPDDGQRNCPKHVEFYSKNKLEKLVHLVGFIIRIYHDSRSPELHIHNTWREHTTKLHASHRTPSPSKKKKKTLIHYQITVWHYFYMESLTIQWISMTYEGT